MQDSSVFVDDDSPRLSALASSSSFIPEMGVSSSESSSIGTFTSSSHDPKNQSHCTHSHKTTELRMQYNLTVFDTI